jgi:hypothetical protein
VVHLPVEARASSTSRTPSNGMTPSEWKMCVALDKSGHTRKLNTVRPMACQYEESRSHVLAYLSIRHICIVPLLPLQPSQARYKSGHPSPFVSTSSHLTFLDHFVTSSKHSLTMSLSATWTRLVSSTRLQRSSQTLSVAQGKAWIFGGEVLPREPVDNQIDVVELQSTAADGV